LSPIGLFLSYWLNFIFDAAIACLLLARMRWMPGKPAYICEISGVNLFY